MKEVCTSLRLFLNSHFFSLCPSLPSSFPPVVPSISSLSRTGSRFLHPLVRMFVQQFGQALSRELLPPPGISTG